MLALPTAWKVAGGAIALLLLAALCLGLYVKGRSDEEAVMKAQVAEAVAQQAAHDQAESAKQIGIRDKTIAALQASKTTVAKVINAAPDTNGCGPAVGAALDWVQQRQRAGAKTP